jgi:ABC-type antimicrobial peptide transport system permease subunit
MLYFPASANAKRSMMLLVRGKDDTSATLRRFDSALGSLIPNQAAVASSLEEALVLQVYPFRAASWIGFLLGAVALALTLSGMYGVMAYLVSQRTKEIGIRMALGATPGSVVRLILGSSLRLAAAGLALGLLVSLGTSRLLHHWLSMLKAYDVPAYAMGLTVVLAAAMAAAFFPSTRAAHINPVDTLRAE